MRRKLIPHWHTTDDGARILFYRVNVLDENGVPDGWYAVVSLRSRVMTTRTLMGPLAFDEAGKMVRLMALDPGKMYRLLIGAVREMERKRLSKPEGVTLH